jgi:hypothetical protein
MMDPACAWRLKPGAILAEYSGDFLEEQHGRTAGDWVAIKSTVEGQRK